MFQTRLPGDPVVLGMGITSVAVIFIFGDLTFFLFIGFVLGFVGVSKGADSLRLYEENPEAFYEKSRKNVADGRHICGFATLASIIMLIYKLVMYFVN